MIAVSKYAQHLMLPARFITIHFIVFQVADMQVELEELQPKLVVASEENTKMMAVCIL